MDSGAGHECSNSWQVSGQSELRLASAELRRPPLDGCIVIPSCRHVQDPPPTPPSFLWLLLMIHGTLVPLILCRGQSGSPCDASVISVTPSTCRRSQKCTRASSRPPTRTHNTHTRAGEEEACRLGFRGPARAIPLIFSSLVIRYFTRLLLIRVIETSFYEAHLWSAVCNPPALPHNPPTPPQL